MHVMYLRMHRYNRTIYYIHTYIKNISFLASFKYFYIWSYQRYYRNYLYSMYKIYYYLPIWALHGIIFRWNFIISRLYKVLFNTLKRERWKNYNDIAVFLVIDELLYYYYDLIHYSPFLLLVLLLLLLLRWEITRWSSKLSDRWEISRAHSSCIQTYIRM